MAGDWIKIRTNLDSDPRVWAIARACGVSVNEAIGGLYRLWRNADQQTTDGWLPGADETWIDAQCGVEGFADALQNVTPSAWLKLKKGGVQIPRFGEHNGQPAKQRALASERQKKKRHASVTKSSRTKRDESVTREEREGEKRGGNKSPPNPPKPEQAELPASLESEAFRRSWGRWCQHRRERRQPLKPTTVKSQLRKLESMGHDTAIEALEHSIEQGYQGIYPPKSSTATKGKQDPREYEEEVKW